MAAIYSKRFAGPVLMTVTGQVVVFTVPSGHIYVVRMLALVNISTTVGVTARVGIGTLPAGEPRIFKKLLAVDETIYADVRVPLTAGETLHVNASVANTLVATVAGYDFVDS